MTGIVGNIDVLESFHRVTSYELDSFGHVNNAIFLNYLEKARCDFMLLKGLHFNDFFKWHRYPVVVRAALEYKHPALADDKLVIRGWIAKHTATSFLMKYEILNRDSKQLILTGETFHVFVDDNNRPSRIPEEFSKNFLNKI